MSLSQLPVSAVPDGVKVVTSSTRPASPGEGQCIYETDTDKFLIYNGAAWIEGLDIGAWDTWTPTWSNFTPSTSTIVAKYTRGGRTIHWRLSITLAGSFSVGDIRFSPPVNTAADYPTGSFGHRAGDGVLLDAATNHYEAFVNLQGVDTFRILNRSSASPLTLQVLSSTVPFTWAAGDIISVDGSYEAAS